MSKINDGGPAFPQIDECDSYPPRSGMSLRDYFAARAPQPPAAWWGCGPVTCAGYAMWAYQYADAMLAARTKGGDAVG